MAYSRQDILLTDEEVSTLKRRLAKFRKASAPNRSCIIQDAVKDLKTTWRHQIAFDQKVVETVPTILTVFFPAHTCLACPKVPI